MSGQVTCNFDGQQADFWQQGATFRFFFYWEDSEGTRIDLSNYIMRMQVRKNFQQALIIELSTTNGRILVDSNEEAQLYLTAEEMSLIPPGQYVYDLEITALDGITTGDTINLFGGEIIVKPEVTI